MPPRKRRFKKTSTLHPGPQFPEGTSRVRLKGQRCEDVKLYEELRLDGSTSFRPAEATAFTSSVASLLFKLAAELDIICMTGLCRHVMGLHKHNINVMGHRDFYPDSKRKLVRLSAVFQGQTSCQQPRKELCGAVRVAPQLQQRTQEGRQGHGTSAQESCEQ